MFYKEKVKLIINDKEKFSKMNAYVKLIEEINKKINLTGFSKDKLWKEGIYESLVCFFNITFKGQFLDIGAGAGFPSVPLLIFNPKIKLTIIEAKKKRINFLEKVINNLNLKINLINKRCEDVKDQKFDFITARAVAPLKKLIKISYHLGKKDATFYWIKGNNVEKEWNEAKKIISKLKIKNIKIIQKLIDKKTIKIIKYIRNIENFL